MGTRSLTIVYESDSKKPNVIMYRQMDGYPSGHGLELAEFLKPIKMVNGIGLDSRQVANGGGCLAAQIVAYFKKGPGGIYLQACLGDRGEEYEYIVRADETKGIEVTCRGGLARTQLFKGSVSAFEAWCKEH